MSFGASAPPVVDVVKQKLYDFTEVAFDVKHYLPACTDLPTSEPSSPQDTYTMHIPEGQDPTGKVAGWACVMTAFAEVHLAPRDTLYKGNSMAGRAVKNGEEFPARSTGTFSFGIDFLMGAVFTFACNVKEGDVIGAKVWRGNDFPDAPVNLVFVTYQLVPVSFSITGLVQFYWDGSVEGKPVGENCQHEKLEDTGIHYGVLGPDVTMLGGEVVTFYDMWLTEYNKLSPMCMAVSKMQFNQDDGFFNTAYGSRSLDTEAYPIKIAALTVED